MEQMPYYGFEMIHAEDVAGILQREQALLVDLRSEEKFQKGHMKHAKNFPFAYIREWKDEMPEKISLIFYCEYGNQSLLAARKLRKRKGPVYTVLGGYQEYLKYSLCTEIQEENHIRRVEAGEGVY